MATLDHASRWAGFTFALSVLVVCAMAASNVASASDQPDQLIIGSKLIVKSNSGDATKNKLIFQSKDDSFTLPDAGNDPTMEGAVLRVIDLGSTAGSATITLASTRWQAITGGFKYKGQSGDPCKIVLIKDDKLVKVVCKGASVTLAPPFGGAAALALEVGTTSIRYCATFGGSSVVKNILKPNGKGLFKAKNAPAPAACFDCGDGNLDAGEQCDDGNTLDGDCCSAACQFEANATPCDDGDPCTLSGLCDGAGQCVSDPLCGNDVVDAWCGEQCDGSDDSACENRCLPTCSCPPEPGCAADPTRTLFAGGPETSACNAYDDNQILCEQAFHLGNGGVSSCYYDVDNEECNGCGPDSQAEGVCMNTCRPVTCPGDPSRTMFAGGPNTQACQEFGVTAGTANCELAFHIGQFGVASCYYDANADECRGCGPANQDDGNCENTCAACQADPTRTIFAGGPGTQACHQFDGDQATCNQAFHRDQCGNDTSCYYDSNGTCSGCGPNNQAEGLCRNTCELGPLTCTNDPSRTIDAGGSGTQACHQFDGDAASCQQAFHHTECNQPTSCYYDFPADECRGCGPSNEIDGSCVNTCIAGPITCPADPSRVFLAGLPGSSGCREFGQTAGTAACELAFNIGSGGVASCYNDGSDCQGCGPPNEGNGECRNTCVHGPPACADDPSRTVYAGGPNTQACHQFDGDQASCEAAFHTGQCGEASCFYDSGICSGCGPNNQLGGDCTNTCDDPTCGDPTRTIFAGGPGNSACHFFDGNQTLCEKAFHLGESGVASCFYDSDLDECKGCGPNNQNSGDCVNTCPTCGADPARTVFAGSPNTVQACDQFDGNQAACEGAFQFDDCGRATSCYFSFAATCLPCDAENFANGECQNTCVVGPPTCERDPSRTIFAGGPGTQACQQFSGDPVSCLKAFHRGQNGGIASCTYDTSSGDCIGCGQGQAGSGDCLNTCLHGVPACTEDPSRTIFAGLPNTAACSVFDGNQQACEDAYHFDQCRNAASCYYDTDLDVCNGCGPNNEQDGNCINTCAHGPASCDLDSSRVNFGGGPGSQACTSIDDQGACLATFHVGQCGVASCFWNGSGCQGCGPSNEFDAECFNTCQAP